MRKTLRVAELLETRIRNGGLIPPTQKIATDFAVSYKTAYQAVTELVDRKVAYRVKGRGAFALPNNSFNKVKTFGVLWGRERDQKRAQTSITFKEILMGINIQSGLEKLNIRHLLYHDGIEDEIIDIDFLLSLNCILSDPDKHKLLKKIKCPHLFLEIWKPPTHSGSSLCIDTARSFRKAFEYLTELGKKNIAIIHHDENKLLGHSTIFAQIKAQMELPHRPEWEIFSGKYNSIKNEFETAFKAGVGLGNDIIKNFPELDGLICVSDHVAAGIYSVTRKAKPNLAVMGMDNIEGMGYYPLGKPTLSCIAPDYFELGKQAVKILTHMSGDRSVTYLNSKLKIRKSCGE